MLIDLEDLEELSLGSEDALDELDIEDEDILDTFSALIDGILEA